MRLLSIALMLGAIGLLAACAAPAVAPAGAAGGGPRTASDQTDADRRAAIRMELAELHYNQGQFEMALDQIKLALAAKPDLGAAFSLRGLVYASMGEEALAEDSFARALQINPRDANTLHNRGWFLCQHDKFERADALFDEALAIPQYRDALRTYLAQGVCDSRAGRLEQAERKLSRAYELDPSNPTTASNLADVLYKRGQYERAQFYIGRVNQREDQSNAQTLWLALRVENRLGNRARVEELGRQLRNRFPQAPQTLAYESGRLDE